MRIVIDLLGCQSTSSRNRGIGRYSLSLAIAMAKQAGEHDVWLALNGKFIDTIEPIRKAFEAYISPNNFLVYDVPSFEYGLFGAKGEIDSRNAWRIFGAERIREFTISSLNPDILHVSSLFEGLTDNAVTSVGLLESTFTTAVTLYDLIPLIKSDIYLQDSSGSILGITDKIESLKKAEVVARYF
jgi:hypothetical protein